MASASEIKLALKERLALANSQGESASKRLAKAKATMKRMMETLTEDVDDAQKQFDTSQSEIKKAADALKAAEERHEIVTIDSDSEDEEENSKKKMKVSMEEEASEDEDMGDEENNNNNQVVVMGCGSTEVNGTYKQDDELKSIVNCSYNYTKLYNLYWLITIQCL